MSILSIFELLGGLAFFLFGMNVMSNSLEKMAGGKLEGILKKMTSNPAKGMALGILVTIAIQSSSALTVMLVGLVNSGIMDIAQTVSVIMGSNIGTTLTAWVLSLNAVQSSGFAVFFKPENFSPVIAFIGIILVMASKNARRKDLGTIFCGFAILMTGMTFMSTAVAPIADVPEFQKLLVAFDNPFFGVLIGTLFTGIIQSSAASIGVLQALSLTGSIKVGMALPIVMGANIGTCVTAIISGIGVNPKAKRVPTIHISINIIGMVVWMAFYVFARYILRVAVFGDTITSFQIAVFHSIFNVGTVIILLPFQKALARLAEKLFPPSAEEERQRKVYLDERLLLSPGLAVQRCRDLTGEMGVIAKDALVTALSLLTNYSEEKAASVYEKEEQLDSLEDALDTYMIKLSAKDMTETDSGYVNEMLHTINDFERIGDHAINIVKSAKMVVDEGMQFSPAAVVELSMLSDALHEILTLTVDSFQKDDEKTAVRVEPLEEVIDDLTKEIRNHHIIRVQNGECSGRLSIVMTDLLTDCERVSDHCSNVAVAIIQTKNASFEVHDYLQELKQGQESVFVGEFTLFKKKYTLPEETVPVKKKKHKSKEKTKGKDKGTKEKLRGKSKEKGIEEKGKDTKDENAGEKPADSAAGKAGMKVKQGA